MATVETPYVEIRDHVTGAEIHGIGFPVMIAPRAGERIHYWQDGFPASAGVDSGIRHDFLVMRVEHDWRYMPARVGSSAKYVPSIILHVLAQGDTDLIPAPPRDRRPTHPGELFAESIAAIGMSQEEAAAKLGIPQSMLRMFIQGKCSFPGSLSAKIGQLLGNGAGLWIRMQAAVDIWDAENGNAEG